MEALEIFLWIVTFGNLANFFYVLCRTPFWNFDKQFLWKMWVLFSFFLLIVLAIIGYFHGITNKWIWATILLGLGANLYSLSFVENEFKAVIKNEIHSFKVERIENGRIFGTLKITKKDEYFPAELVNASHRRYKLGDLVTVSVVTCTIEEIKVEPETN